MTRSDQTQIALSGNTQSGMAAGKYRMRLHAQCDFDLMARILKTNTFSRVSKHEQKKQSRRIYQYCDVSIFNVILAPPYPTLVSQQEVCNG